jgi:hypothetical protein
MSVWGKYGVMSDEDWMDGVKDEMNKSDGFMNAMGHMVGMRQREKTNKEIRELKQVITQQHQKEASLPKCPWCAGPIERNVSKCRHCTSNIGWVNITYLQPCKPQDRMATTTQQEKKSKEQIKKKGEIERVQDELIECYNCGEMVQRRDFVRSQSKCKSCVGRIEGRNMIALVIIIVISLVAIITALFNA